MGLEPFLAANKFLWGVKKFRISREYIFIDLSQNIHKLTRVAISYVLGT